MSIPPLKRSLALGLNLPELGASGKDREILANQARLVLHTGAYWLLLLVRNAIPKAHALARAEFATLRLHLVKIGVRIAETATRVRAAFCASCPHAPLFALILAALGCDSS